MKHIRTVFDRRTFLSSATVAGAAALTGSGLAVPAVGTAAPRHDSAGLVVSRDAGRLQVMCLLDASGPFTLGAPAEVFPEAGEADWAAARSIDPGAFGADGAWQLNFQCFVIAGPASRIALVDTGVGPAGSPASSWAPTPGRLPQALADIGIGVDDVDLVVQTHLHSDHVGWAVYPDGRPVFPQARYVVQRTEVAALEAAGSALVPYVVQPLRASGQLHELDGRTRLSAGRGRRGRHVAAVPTPGHTPGHQSVVIDDRGDRIVITGDVLVHAVQLANPDVSYAYEDDHDAARATRHALLGRARRRHTVLATAHLNRPFVTVC